jgi:hypothetical protein
LLNCATAFDTNKSWRAIGSRSLQNGTLFASRSAVKVLNFAGFTNPLQNYLLGTSLLNTFAL